MPSTFHPTPEFLAAANARIREVLYDLRPQLLEASGKIEHELKPDHTIVTKWDLLTERRIHAALTELDPAIGLAGEETGADLDLPTFWLVDPIDGTEHFMRGLPFFTNMIALIHRGEPVMGVIYNPTLDEYFHATKGGGATLNGHPIHTSSRTLDRGFVSFSSPIKDERLIGFAGHLRNQLGNIISFAAAGYTFSSIARGAIEGIVTYATKAKPWDMAPGALLVAEAGGRIANIGSDAYDFRNTYLIASNQTTYQPLQRFVAHELEALIPTDKNH